MYRIESETALTTQDLYLFQKYITCKPSVTREWTGRIWDSKIKWKLMGFRTECIYVGRKNYSFLFCCTNSTFLYCTLGIRTIPEKKLRYFTKRQTELFFRLRFMLICNFISFFILLPFLFHSFFCLREERTHFQKKIYLYFEANNCVLKTLRWKNVSQPTHRPGTAFYLSFHGIKIHRKKAALLPYHLTKKVES